MQKLVVPNTQFACFFANGLKDDAVYHFYNRRLKHNIKEFGELVNMVSPVHIKQGSLVQELASKFVKLDERQKIIRLTETHLCMLELS